MHVLGLLEAVADDVLEFIAVGGCEAAALVQQAAVEGGGGEAVGGYMSWDEEGGHADMACVWCGCGYWCEVNRAWTGGGSEAAEWLGNGTLGVSK